MRSMVGLLPLCATTVFDGKGALAKYPEIAEIDLQRSMTGPEK